MPLTVRYVDGLEIGWYHEGLYQASRPSWDERLFF